MAAVVVGAPLGRAGHQRQDRGGAVQGLNAGLFVRAEHDRGLWGVQVQPHDVAGLVDGLRVRRQLGLLGEVRLETERPPDGMHRRRRDAHCFGHRPRRPVRRVDRGGLQGEHDHLLNGGVVDGARRTRPRIVAEPVEAPLGEPAAPLGRRRGMAPQLGGDLFVVAALGRPQHDPAPQSQRLRRLRAPSPPLQRGAFLVVQQHHSRRPSPPCTHIRPRSSPAAATLPPHHITATN